MNTASILIKTDLQVKVKAQKTAEKMGLSLTSVINRYLKHFITAETITFSTSDETPNQYLINAFYASLPFLKDITLPALTSSSDSLKALMRY